jgi:hypothetical protein
MNTDKHGWGKLEQKGRKGTKQMRSAECGISVGALNELKRLNRLNGPTAAEA